MTKSSELNIPIFSITDCIIPAQIFKSAKVILFQGWMSKEWKIV